MHYKQEKFIVLNNVIVIYNKCRKVTLKTVNFEYEIHDESVLEKSKKKLLILTKKGSIQNRKVKHN